MTAALVGPTVFVGFLAWEGSIVWGISRAALGPGRFVAGVGIVHWLGLRVVDISIFILFSNFKISC